MQKFETKFSIGQKVVFFQYSIDPTCKDLEKRNFMSAMPDIIRSITFDKKGAQYSSSSWYSIAESELESSEDAPIRLTQELEKGRIKDL